jgi:hypothetical protein
MFAGVLFLHLVASLVAVHVGAILSLLPCLHRDFALHVPLSGASDDAPISVTVVRRPFSAVVSPTHGVSHAASATTMMFSPPHAKASSASAAPGRDAAGSDGVGTARRGSPMDEDVAALFDNDDDDWAGT